MGLEIEKKYRLTVEQRAFVLDALNNIGAEYSGENLEENTIYGGDVLEEQNAAVRIRKTQDGAILTYKKRILNNLSFKQQIEHESGVSDVAEVEAILRYLGLTPRLVYEKRRKTWRFRSVEIVLDELPFGLFMEIEGSITGIAEAEMLLDIEHFESELETYPRMTARFGKQSEGLIEARFEKE